jgi:hypothetical protein
MILETLDVDEAAFAAGTGWQIKAEGACRFDTCVPLDGGPFDVADVARRLGMAIVHDEAAGLWAIGPESLGGRALTSAEAPDLSLPDVLTGDEVRLSSLRGTKVVLAAWAPY